MAQSKREIRKVRKYGSSFVISIPHEFVKALALKVPQDVIIHLGQAGLYIQPLRLDRNEVPMEFKNLCALPE